MTITRRTALLRAGAAVAVIGAPELVLVKSRDPVIAAIAGTSGTVEAAQV
jgi:hypothetical protein